MARSKELQRIARMATRRANLAESEADRLVLVLKAFLERQIRKAVRKVHSDATVREAAKMLSDLESAVMAAGLGDKIAGIKALFERELGLVAEDFTDTTGKVAALSGLAQKDLAAFVDERLELATRLVNDYLGDVRIALLDSVLLGKRFSVTEALASVGDAPFHHLKTEIDTALMAYQRVAHLAKAEKAGIGQFLYVGPDDQVTRPFCQDHVGGVFTLSEIEGMDNGQGLPVAIYGGGYNCRHHWRPVSQQLAKELQAAP